MPIGILNPCGSHSSPSLVTVSCMNNLKMCIWVEYRTVVTKVPLKLVAFLTQSLPVVQHNILYILQYFESIIIQFVKNINKSPTEVMSSLVIKCKFVNFHKMLSICCYWFAFCTICRELLRNSKLLLRVCVYLSVFQLCCVNAKEASGTGRV